MAKLSKTTHHVLVCAHKHCLRRGGREAGGPLHVNELYTRLPEGGFHFTGHNPTISIAVSLTRNRRFRKVAPGTFDLTIRDAAQAV